MYFINFFMIKSLCLKKCNFNIKNIGKVSTLIFLFSRIINCVETQFSESDFMFLTDSQISDISKEKKTGLLTKFINSLNIFIEEEEIQEITYEKLNRIVHEKIAGDGDNIVRVAWQTIEIFKTIIECDEKWFFGIDKKKFDFERLYSWADRVLKNIGTLTDILSFVKKFDNVHDSRIQNGLKMLNTKLVDFKNGIDKIVNPNYQNDEDFKKVFKHITNQIVTTISETFESILLKSKKEKSDKAYTEIINENLDVFALSVDKTLDLLFKHKGIEQTNNEKIVFFLNEVKVKLKVFLNTEKFILSDFESLQTEFKNYKVFLKNKAAQLEYIKGLVIKIKNQGSNIMSKLHFKTHENYKKLFSKESTQVDIINGELVNPITKLLSKGKVTVDHKKIEGNPDRKKEENPSSDALEVIDSEKDNKEDKKWIQKKIKTEKLSLYAVEEIDTGKDNKKIQIKKSKKELVFSKVENQTIKFDINDYFEINNEKMILELQNIISEGSQLENLAENLKIRKTKNDKSLPDEPLSKYMKREVISLN